MLHLLPALVQQKGHPVNQIYFLVFSVARSSVVLTQYGYYEVVYLQADQKSAKKKITAAEISSPVGAVSKGASEFHCGVNSQKCFSCCRC